MAHDARPPLRPFPSRVDVALLFLLLVGMSAATPAAPSPFLFGASSSAPAATRAALDAFGARKLGMFMHHGPVAQWGSEISWPLVCKALPCIVQTKRKPGDTTPTTRNITTVEELREHRQAYRDLAKTYDPTGFNATDIAVKARRAGFKYVVYTTVHCDGFANWNTSMTDYNIMRTPYGRDIFGELAAALRREGLLVGAYVCPTLWNNDQFWWPDALSAVGVAESPTYNTTERPDLWQSYLSTLHGMVSELATKYQPDLFWFDCHDSPTTMDTMLERVVAPIRSANPSALILVRNGPFSDYAELVDKSAASAESILGQIQTRAGTQFEAGDTLQTSGLWSFDPTSAQRPVSEMLANLMLMSAKGGNYLINIGPGPDGKWSPSAEKWLVRTETWMERNEEALVGATPMDPYEATTNAGTAYYTSKIVKTEKTYTNDTVSSFSMGVNVYAMIPSAAPKVVGAERPTGRRRGASQVDRRKEHQSSFQEQPQMRQRHAPALNGGLVTLGTFRAALMSPGMTLEKVELVGIAGTVKFAHESDGLHLDARSILPSPMPQHLEDGLVFKLSFVQKEAGNKEL